MESKTKPAEREKLKHKKKKSLESKLKKKRVESVQDTRQKKVLKCLKQIPTELKAVIDKIDKKRKSVK